jgi:hypothetical protein
VAEWAGRPYDARMRTGGVLITAVVAAVAGALAAGAPAEAVIPSGNLLANPSLEDGAASPDGNTSVAIPGWNDTTRYPSPTVVRYGTAGGFPESGNTAETGDQFFAGGAPALDSGKLANVTQLGQAVDISGVSEVKNGNVQAILTGCLGGYASDDDFVTLTLRDRVTVGNTTSFQTLAEKDGPKAADRQNQTALLPVSLAANAPAAASGLVVQLTFRRFSGAGTYNDGYADNLRLTLQPSGTAAPAPLPCPKPAATQGSALGAPTSTSGTSGFDKTKPTLGGLSFSSTVFEAAKFGASTAKKKPKVGTKVSFSLSEASSVKFTVQRKTKGRKVGRKCKAATQTNRKKKACTLWKAVTGSFTIKGKAGKNTFTFRGRVGGKTLKPASYRLNGTATDPAKNASLPKQKGFKIVK